MRWCYKESNTLCRQLELATRLLSSPSLIITKFETLQNNNIYTQKQVFLHKVGLNLGSTDISDWRCVVLDADTWCIGVQHRYMWSHSIPFIFLNYRCLCDSHSILSGVHAYISALKGWTHLKMREENFPERNLQRQHNKQKSIQPKQQMQSEIHCTCDVTNTRVNYIGA
jgi:hypothetical protein